MYLRFTTAGAGQTATGCLAPPPGLKQTELIIPYNFEMFQRSGFYHLLKYTEYLPESAFPKTQKYRACKKLPSVFIFLFLMAGLI